MAETMFLVTSIYEKISNVQKQLHTYLENTMRCGAPQGHLGSHSITECLKEILHDSYA